MISFDNRLDKGKYIPLYHRARSWELTDDAKDGYLNADIKMQTFSEGNLPLALTHSRTHVTETLNPGKGSRPKIKLASGGKYYRRPADRKNREPCSNLMKDDIIDSFDHPITLDNGHIQRKLDLTFQGKLLPGPNKIVMNHTPFGHKLTLSSSLAGIGKLSPPKKIIGRDQTHLRQGSTRVDTHSRTPGLQTGTTAAYNFLRNTSSSSSSLNLNSWDGLIDEYFEDMSNNNLPFSQQVGSGPNHELSITADDHTHTTTSHSPGTAEHPVGMDVPESMTREGSEKNPVLIDSSFEEFSPVGYQPRPSRSRRNVGPTQILWQTKIYR